MPRDSSGAYTRAGAGSTTPYVNGNVADADVVNAEMDDIGSEITASLEASGKKTWTGNQPAGGYLVTGLGAPSSANDSARKAYVDSAISGLSATYQPLDATLTAIAAGATGSNVLFYWTGTDILSTLTMTASAITALAAMSAAGAALIDDADAAAQRTTLGLGTGGAAIGTASEVRSNAAGKILATGETWDALDTVTLTDAATIAVDFSTFINAKVTLGGNRTLGQPSNVGKNQSGIIEIIQDGTGSRTLAYHADWLFANGTDPTLSTAASARDLLFYQVLSDGKTYATLVRAVA